MDLLIRDNNRMRYVPKVVKLGGRNNTSYGIIIPKVLVEKYGYDREEYVILEEDEFKKILVIKNIPI